MINKFVLIMFIVCFLSACSSIKENNQVSKEPIVINSSGGIIYLPHKEKCSQEVHGGKIDIKC